jgi:hypothetical protein
MSYRIVREAIWRVPWLSMRGTIPARDPSRNGEAKP